MMIQEETINIFCQPSQRKLVVRTKGRLVPLQYQSYELITIVRQVGEMEHKQIRYQTKIIDCSGAAFVLSFYRNNRHFVLLGMNLFFPFLFILLIDLLHVLKC